MWKFMCLRAQYFLRYKYTEENTVLQIWEKLIVWTYIQQDIFIENNLELLYALGDIW